MNTKNLHELINRYEDNFYLINDKEHDEIFKWKVVKSFRDVWFSDEYKQLPFSERFHLATKDSSVMINNSRITPTNGVVKLAEEFPVEVETLFAETLFSGETDPVIVHDQMERFLDGMEKMRQEKFPRFFRYKQERHAASCYLTFFNPSVHFVYRYSDAEEFATYIEFGKDIGAGANFNLAHYYEMANVVVEALKEHPSLIERHKEFIKDAPKYYRDYSLHLMAFDLMYCCRCYNLYSGLSHATKKESINFHTQSQIREREQRERQKRIQEIENELHRLDVELAQYDDISLMGVEVQDRKWGVGTVVFHDHDMIAVAFGDTERKYRLNKKYSQHPTFEDDSFIIEEYTKYSEQMDARKKIRDRLNLLMNF